MISVVGISQSSRADLLARIDALGTNLLTVSPSRGFENDPSAVPPEAPAMIRRIGPVHQASAVGIVTVDGSAATVRRSDRIDVVETGGLRVLAAQPDLLNAVGGTVDRGRFLDDAIDRYPTVVLGHDAALQLGVDLEVQPAFVYIAQRSFTVAGILHPVGLAPELDRAALIGFPEAADLGGPGSSTAISTLYVRAAPGDTTAVQSVLGRTANPASPGHVTISRPSDALVARAAADDALNALILGLGAIALFVGGLGIANVMIIAVLERRPRSAYAARWAQRVDKSGCNSSPSRSYSQPPAASSASHLAPRSPSRGHVKKAGASRSPQGLSQGPCSRRSRSVPSQASTPRCEPPASPPPKHSAPPDPDCSGAASLSGSTGRSAHGAPRQEGPVTALDVSHRKFDTRHLTQLNGCHTMATIQLHH